MVYYPENCQRNHSKTQVALSNVPLPNPAIYSVSLRVNLGSRFCTMVCILTWPHSLSSVTFIVSLLLVAVPAKDLFSLLSLHCLCLGLVVCSTRSIMLNLLLLVRSLLKCPISKNVPDDHLKWHYYHLALSNFTPVFSLHITLHFLLYYAIYWVIIYDLLFASTSWDCKFHMDNDLGFLCSVFLPKCQEWWAVFYTCSCAEYEDKN